MAQKCCFRKKDNQVSTCGSSGELGSEGKESESVEPCPSFDIEHTALQSVCVGSNHQLALAAKRAVQMTVVEMSLLFWRLEAPLRGRSFT